MQKISVVCVKWGDKYGPEFVNRLYTMAKRNLTYEFDFYCYTEDPRGIIPECIILPIPEDNDLESYWNKVALFKPGLLKGRVLYLDLDTVIQSNIDCFITYNEKMLTGVKTYWSPIETDGKHPLVTMRYKTTFNSSIMVWDAEDYYWFWDHFESDKDWFIIKYFMDDKFIGNELLNHLDVFPRHWIYSRLGGLDETINHESKKFNELISFSNVYASAFYYPECKICMLNGGTMPVHYERLAKYWS